MIKSMTGFGKKEINKNNKTISMEIKSVNHRYCEINIRIPRLLLFLENEIKSQIKKRISRGKIDVFINFDDIGKSTNSLIYNKELAKEYMCILTKISNDFNVNNTCKSNEISKMPEVVTLKNEVTNEDEIKEIVLETLNSAIDELIDTRKKEGELLCQDLILKLDNVEKLVNNIKEFAPLVVEEYRRKLYKRIDELVGEKVDKERLAVEVAIFADKCCIDEEIVRLLTHVKHMKEILENNKPVGRKLDFISQELNREANTILSKANNVNISKDGIELKSIIEMIREQIQNIE